MRNRPTKAWWRAYGSLMGEQIELGETKPERSKKKSPSLGDVPTEVQEQVVAATWLSKKNIPFYHIPNGGYRNALEGAKFKRMGVKAGVPDLCIVVSRKGYHGLYIELKRVSGGTLSDSQKFWGELLTKQGYLWKEAKGAKEVIEIVEDYFDDK